MADMAELEVRIRLLEEECRELRKLKDIEAIKRLRHKYLRCIDMQTFDRLIECFAEDAVADFGPTRKFQGRNAVVKFIKEKASHIHGARHGHNPEIDITSDTTAEGTWALYSYLIDKDVDKGLRILAYHFDEYVKVGGEWKISSTTDSFLLREIWNRNQTDEMPQEN